MAFHSVNGKTAIVTGAGAGINLCFAKLLLSQGCNVVLADLSLRPESQEVIDAYSKGSPRAVFQQTDVTDWPQLERMFSVAEQRFGSADIVCPGAGVYEPVRAIGPSSSQANTHSPSQTSGFHLAPNHRETHQQAAAIPLWTSM